MLQDRISSISQYFRSIEMAGTYPIVKVCYPEKWGVYNGKDGRVNVTRSEDTVGEWFYFTTDETVNLDDVFDLIEETINMNLSAIAKIELLKAKVEELKEVFSSESLERLQRLEFVIKEDEQAKPKKKAQRKPKTVKKEKKEPVVEDNVVVDHEELNKDVENVFEQ